MKNLRMLYVEDESLQYEIYSNALKKRGWIVERACNPPQAMERIRAAQVPYEVILIDRKLDLEDGKPQTWPTEWKGSKTAGDLLLDRVVAEAPYSCPIMFTVLDQAHAARDLTKHGAQDYLVKALINEKGNPGDLLDKRCRQAMVRHQLKRLRHPLLRQPTFDSLLKEIFLFVRDSFESGGAPLNLFYLEMVPGRALQIHAAAGNERPLVGALRSGETSGVTLPLVSATGNIYQVLQRSRRALTTDVRALVGQTLTGSAAMQLLVPVLVMAHPDQSAHRPAGIFAVECDKSFVEDEDLELFENITALLADYLAARAWHRRLADQEREEEQKSILDGIACRLCGPLQQAQSGLELLNLQLQGGQTPDADQLRESVGAALDAMERATLATENIRFYQPIPSLTPGEFDLARLVERTLRRCQRNLVAAKVEVDDSLLKQHDAVFCRMDAEHLSYVLEGLLRNCWETALREQAGRAGSEDARWRLILRLDLDSQHQSVRLTLRDNGPGFSNEILARFEEGGFIPSQKRFQGRRRKGLGLVEARRFLEMSDGRMEIRNAQEGGALVQLFLPLHGPQASGNVIVETPE